MRLVALLLALSLSGPVAAQHSHSAIGHAMPGPQEAGQSAFAAMAEIAALLRADPDTDWANVDIAALRRHLVDMELVTTEALAPLSRDFVLLALTAQTAGPVHGK